MLTGNITVSRAVITTTFSPRTHANPHHTPYRSNKHPCTPKPKTAGVTRAPQHADTIRTAVERPPSYSSPAVTLVQLPGCNPRAAPRLTAHRTTVSRHLAVPRRVVRTCQDSRRHTKVTAQPRTVGTAAYHLPPTCTPLLATYVDRSATALSMHNTSRAEQPQQNPHRRHAPGAFTVTWNASWRHTPASA